MVNSGGRSLTVLKALKALRALGTLKIVKLLKKTSKILRLVHDLKIIQKKDQCLLRVPMVPCCLGEVAFPTCQDAWFIELPHPATIRPFSRNRNLYLSLSRCTTSIRQIPCSCSPILLRCRQWYLSYPFLTGGSSSQLELFVLSEFCYLEALQEGLTQLAE